MRGVKKLENANVVVLVFVWGIEKDKIGCDTPRRKPFKSSHSICFNHLRAGANSKRFQILADEPRSGCVRFDEDPFARAAADRLDANGAGSRKKINKKRILD